MVVINLVLYGFGLACIGAVAAWWLRGVYYRKDAKKEESTKSHYATEILVRLQELASRVAVDVDEHNSQIEQINDKLTEADKRESSVIIEVVAKLIQANQHMKQKLSSTEDRLREQAQEIQLHVAEARTDALTMLSNRRAFDSELKRRIAEYQRLCRAFSLIMADVDYFKKFNDVFGHQAGDEVLRGVAKLLRRTMREMDLVARYGGEEFAMILPGTNLEDAANTALRACETIEKSFFRYQGKDDLHVTLSFGVAKVQPHESGAELLARADKALYHAKENGRNCVSKHDGTNIKHVAPRQQPVLPQNEGQPAVDAPGKESEIGKTPNALSKADGEKPGSENDDVPRGDEVSELPSRTNFCQQVRSRTAEWKRGGSAFSVVLIEVGQAAIAKECSLSAGEPATLVVARKLHAIIREMDVLGNYAPGCMALLLPAVELADAIRIADRLQEELSLSVAGEVAERPKITLSIGVAQVMDGDDSISLLKRAEEALDAADRREGTQTFFHDGKRCAPVTAMLEMMNYLT